MRRQLSLPIVPAPLPDGISLLPFSKEAVKAGRELMQRIYTEGLGDNGISFEGFWEWLTGDPDYDPTLMFIAADSGRIVGFCHCWSGDFIKDLVVDAAYRRCGLGTALLTLALEAFKARGADHVDLKTDTDNETAQSLYRRLGFEIIERIDG